ncbi:hypothetical protein GCM10011320_17410 [Neoroseomonas lacus]|uniref:Uncharacterized protein n=2 Tax=Neoroseomonas lacus TaxID=287609 RepID=A0A917KGI7_9PROT|nr:hypothetical protein GCM10011320_17410 [Neoroseomonas lacus]
MQPAIAHYERHGCAFCGAKDFSAPYLLALDPAGQSCGICGQCCLAVPQPLLWKVIGICADMHKAPGGGFDLPRGAWLDDDLLWFRDNPGRSLRLRRAWPGELQQMAADGAAGIVPSSAGARNLLAQDIEGAERGACVAAVIVRQIRPGLRLRLPIGLLLGTLDHGEFSEEAIRCFITDEQAARIDAAVADPGAFEGEVARQAACRIDEPLIAMARAYGRAPVR